MNGGEEAMDKEQVSKRKDIPAKCFFSNKKYFCPREIFQITGKSKMKGMLPNILLLKNFLQ